MTAVTGDATSAPAATPTPTPTRARAVVVNRSFEGQRVTGQQRYAQEVAGRLMAAAGDAPEPEVTALAPRGWWRTSTLRVWAWVQLVLPLLARRAVTVSMTSRAPLWGRRQVVVVHDLFVLNHPEWYSRRYVATHAPLLRAQLRRAAAVVAVSAPVAAQVARLRRDEVAVAPNAPSAVFAVAPSADDDVALRARGLARHSYLLAVGSRDPRKNFARLARAYAILPPALRESCPLVVVGAANAIYADGDVAWPAGTVDAGYVPDDDLRSLYRYARAVVFVSEDEGFGLPLVEAATAGARGLLVSDIEVFRWVCGDQARYVDPYSVESIARGLEEEITDPQNREIHVHHAFSWDHTASVVADVCRRVAAGG